MHTLLLVCALALAAFVMQAGGLGATAAEADYCNPNGSGWSCYWGQENPP